MDNSEVYLVRFIRIPLAILAVVQNLLIIIVVLRHQALKKSAANLLIAQLGFADFIFGIGLCIRIAVTEMSIATGASVYNRFNCLCYGSVTIFGVHLSQTTMLIIALERLYCIRYPHSYRALQKVKWISLLRFIICFVYSALGTAAQFLYLPEQQLVGSCGAGANWNVYYQIYWVFFATALSFFICGIYMISIPALRRKGPCSAVRRQRTAIVILTTTIVTYFILWCIPNFIYFLGLLYSVQHHTLGSAIYFMSLGSGIFAVLHLYLYIWKHRRLRFYFLKTIYCFLLKPVGTVEKKEKELLFVGIPAGTRI